MELSHSVDPQPLTDLTIFNDKYVVANVAYIAKVVEESYRS